MSEATRLKKENEALSQDNQRLNHYLDTVRELYWASHEIAEAQNLLYALNRLLYKVMQVIDAKDGSISRLDEAADELVFILVHGELGRQLPGFRFRSDTGIAGWVVNNAQPLIVNDPRQDQRFFQKVDKEFGFFTNSIATVPIMKEGRVRGVVQLLNKRNGDFSDEDMVLLLMLGQVAMGAFDEMQLRLESGEMEEIDISYQ